MSETNIGEGVSLSTTIKMLALRAISVGAMAENIPSPCASVCSMDAQRQFCEGCLRSIDEIRVWSRANDAQKKQIWVQIAERAAQRRTDSAPSVP